MKFLNVNIKQDHKKYLEIIETSLVESNLSPPKLYYTRQQFVSLRFGYIDQFKNRNIIETEINRNLFHRDQRRTQDFVLGEAQRKFYSHKSTRPSSMYMYVCNFGLYVCIICMDGSSH